MTDSPEAIEAAQLYQRLLTKAAPQGVSGFNWSECQSAFLQGKIGMWLDGVGFAPPLEDPDKSRIVGKVGYGVMPKGPKAQAVRDLRRRHRRHRRRARTRRPPISTASGRSRSRMGARLLQAGGGVPFRHSILNDAGGAQGREDAGGLDRGGVGIGQDQPSSACRSSSR